MYQSEEVANESMAVVGCQKERTTHSDSDSAQMGLDLAQALPTMKKNSHSWKTAELLSVCFRFLFLLLPSFEVLGKQLKH